jgi:hypothetical protein
MVTLGPLTHRTLIFIPAWNEEGSIARVVQEVRHALPETDILVIDDGSQDNTAVVARAAGALVAIHPANLGIGPARRTGYIFALRGGYERIAHCDADGQHTPESIQRLLRAVQDDECDLAIGSRFLEPPASNDGDAYIPSAMRSIGIRLFRRIVSLVTRQRFTDCTSGLYAANRAVIRQFALGPTNIDYPELENIVRTVRNGFRVKEYPVTMHRRIAGTSSITPVKTFFYVFNGVISIFAASLRASEPAPDTRQ